MQFIDGMMDKYILANNIPTSSTKIMLNIFVFSRIMILSMHKKYAKDYRRKKHKELEWPSQSPDLNPIEYIWSYMKRQLQSFHAKNNEELKLIIVEIWDQIPLDFCRQLVMSMTKRISECIAHCGGHTSYLILTYDFFFFIFYKSYKFI